MAAQGSTSKCERFNLTSAVKMRDNTPPSSPFFERGDMDADDPSDGEEDEMIYIGDADEVLEALENEIASDEENERNIDAEYEPLRDDAVFTFAAHNKPVFCGSFNPSLNMVVTGGEDDKAYVWANDIHHTISDHKDSVIAAEFSANGQYLATGDMSGFIQVFDVQKFEAVWTYEMGDMIWMQWHSVANVLLAGSDSGEIYVWLIPSGDCKVLQTSGNKSEVGHLTPDGKNIIAGYADGCIKLWDIKTSSVVCNYEPFTALGHSDAITCIAAVPDNKRFLSGSVDGKVMFANNLGPMCNFFPNGGSIESLAFSSDADAKLFACGTLTGRISLWDINRQSIRLECQPNDGLVGITKIIWPTENLIACGTLDGSVQVYDVRNGQNVRTLLGHAAEVYDIKYRQQDDSLLTTSEDGTAKIFKLQTV